MRAVPLLHIPAKVTVGGFRAAGIFASLNGPNADSDEG